jgi:hypothetical protein
VSRIAIHLRAFKSQSWQIRPRALEVNRSV